jgi:hypothetical protein
VENKHVGGLLAWLSSVNRFLDGAAPSLYIETQSIKIITNPARPFGHVERWGSMPNHAETEQLVKGYVRAIGSGDLERVWSFYADRSTTGSSR